MTASCRYETRDLSHLADFLIASWLHPHPNTSLLCQACPFGARPGCILFLAMRGHLADRMVRMLVNQRALGLSLGSQLSPRPCNYV